ncbi:MAG: molybdopterin molybdotransferase [Alphaproteobacteria bacterium]|nr:molybdopterin molybdotransferase [Alphaproteobacteria bacterium]
MVAEYQQGQRITRLMPLADALAAVDAQVRPVEPRETDVVKAIGRILAADAVAPEARPAAALALRDGWAVKSEETTDAGSYTPAVLSLPPVRVETGDILPPDADAVAVMDAVVFRGKSAEAVASAAPGEGVLPKGADAEPGKPLRCVGQCLRSIDAAVLLGAGISRVSIREPRIRVVRARGAGNVVLDACYGWVARSIEADGGVTISDQDTEQSVHHLEAALHHEGSDAVVILGGTGNGSSDISVSTLAKTGRVEFHGVGLIPGETAAFGFAGARPVLLLPGRIDAALAVWLVIGRRWLGRLTARGDEQMPFMVELSGKITSTVGMAEVVPMRRENGKVEPLASGYLPFSALARADGWVLVPAASEGFPAGAWVAVRPLA